MRYGERLRQAREHAKLKQAELAEAAEIKQPSLSYLETSEASGSEFTPRFARILGVSVDWLADEIGEMIPTREIVTDPTELAAINLLRQMPAPYRVQAVRQIDSLAEFAKHVDDNGTER